MKYSLRTFGDIINAIVEELKIQKTDIESIRRIRRNVNAVYMNEVVPFKRWQWLRSTTTVSNEPVFSTGTAAVQQNLNTVTLTQSPATSRRGYFFSVDGQTDVYKIESHAAGSSSLTLATPFNGTTTSATSYKIWTDSIPLPADCKEVISVSQQRQNSPLQGVGIQEMRRMQGVGGSAFGTPTYYSTGPFVEQDGYEAIAGVPASVGRSSNGLIKTLTFQTDVSAIFTAGDAVRITGAANYSYNGDYVIAAVVSNTISYVSTARAQEATTADTSFVIQEATSPGAASFRNLIIYPAITDKRLSILVDYQLNVEELDADTDEPKMPVENRIVLFYGGMWQSANRERDAEWAQENYSLMQKTLARMAGKTEDTPERPLMRMSRNYLASKRGGGGRRAYTSVDGASGMAPGTGGTGSPSSPTGTPNTVAVFDANGYLIGANQALPGSFTGTTIGYNPAGTSLTSTNLQSAVTELSGVNTTQNSAIAGANNAATAAQATANANAVEIASHEASTVAHGATGAVVGTTNTQTLTNKTLSSPALLGVPTAPTAAASTNSTQVATTAYTDAAVSVLSSSTTTALAAKAPLASPALTGTPTAPTPTNGTNNTQIATTAFVLANAGSPSLTASRAVVSDVTGTLSVSATTSAEIGYVSGVTSALQTQINAKAPLASPALTGTPTAPTAAASTNNTQVATTAYADAAVGVLSSSTTSALALKAPLASPTFTGTPAAPTAAPGTNTTQLASTAFVAAAVAAAPGGVTSVFTRTGAVVAAGGDYTATQVTNTPAGGISATTVQSALNGLDTAKANLASPTFTGTPVAPTAAASTNTTQIATTAYADAAVSVLSGTTNTALALKAPLASPALTGTPTAPTATAGTNTTQVATTAYADAIAALKANIASPTFTGTPAAPTATAGTSTTQLATTAFVATSYAPLASPALTGTPTAPTATVGTNTTQVATTAFVSANAITVKNVPTIQKFTTGSGTYTRPSSPSPIYIRVRMVGGGGGGAGGGNVGATPGAAGGTGGNTTFGSSLLVANGGPGGPAGGGAGVLGGTASLGTGPIGTAVQGAGTPPPGTGTTSNNIVGGPGANSPFGGAGTSAIAGAGIAAVANSGSGGGGGGCNNVASGDGGYGGAAGGFLDAIITSPAATYSYAVGAGGTLGTNGTSGFNGAAGGSGYIEVTEYYQ